MEMLEDATEKRNEAEVEEQDSKHEEINKEADDEDEEEGEEEEEEEEELEDEGEGEGDDQGEEVSRYINYSFFGTVELPVPGQPLALALELELSVVNNIMSFAMSPRGKEKPWDNVLGFDNFDVRPAPSKGEDPWPLTRRSLKMLFSKLAIHFGLEEVTVLKKKPEARPEIPMRRTEPEQRK